MSPKTFKKLRPALCAAALLATSLPSPAMVDAVRPADKKPSIGPRIAAQTQQAVQLIREELLQSLAESLHPQGALPAVQPVSYRPRAAEAAPPLDL